MPAPQFIDFQAIKRKVGITEILEHYGLMDRMRRNGDIITGDCPINRKNHNVAFKANASANCWNCFNQCSCNGDILDFVSRKEKVSLQKAARLIIEWFDLTFEPPITETTGTPAPQTSLRTPVNQPATLSDCDNRTKFAVKRYWEVSDTVYVPADSISQAIEAAHALPLDPSKAEYVPDSINSDPDTDVHPLVQ